ncbi:MAG: ribonuclease R [Parvularculaceae bacterium]|nr:ribonuclease R [Parvularculaceae bacterium]
MGIPTPKELIEWVERENAERSSPVTRRDIAKAFGVKGAARAELRGMLKRLEREGALSLDGKRAKRPGQLPPVTVLTVERMNSDGDLVCSLGRDDIETEVLLDAREAGRVKPAIGVGDRFLGKLREEAGVVVASVLKPLEKPKSKTLGVFRSQHSGGVVEPVSRKARNSFTIGKADKLNAEDGDLVWCEPKPQRGYGPMKARIVEVVGSVEATKNLSLIALAEHDIPVEFPSKVMREAKELSMRADKAHVDITRLPLVTIDPATARDHDDAVHAEKLDDGGFRLTIAIADVSYYVRPGSALDKEAEKRGNSVYLPDRVVPMLPEELSNDLCSLKEGKTRLALCCEVEIGPRGAKKKHRFFRAKIKNHKNLAYEEAQAIEDGHKKGPKEIKVLFEAYRALVAARERRNPLDLDMPERRIIMQDGAIAGIERKERMDAHRLIEECMVLANVCAAETLTQKGREAIFRVHDAPDPERLDGLREYLTPLGYSLPKGDEVRAENLNRVIEMARKKGELEIIALSVLRSQSQAVYDTENIGHFGLSLKRYAHFTSPIRRYADLTVHRGLVRALGLGPGGETDEDALRLSTIGEHISKAERKAVSAERDTESRLLSAHLEDQLGAVFSGRISGVTRVGLFVALDETGADGFVPVRTLGWEYFEHDETKRALVGQKTGGSYHMGMKVSVRLLEATPVQGGLRFEMLTKAKRTDDKDDDERKPRDRKAGRKPLRRSASKPGKPKNKAKAEAPKTKEQPQKPAKNAPAKLKRRPRKKR